MSNTRSWDWRHLQGWFLLCDLLKHYTDYCRTIKFGAGFLERLVLFLRNFVVLLRVNRLSVVSRELFFLATRLTTVSVDKVYILSYARTI